MFVVVGPSGAGKGKLTELPYYIVNGKDFPASNKAKDPTNEELQKVLFSELLQRKPAIYIDNVNQKINSEALATAVTASNISGRILGTNKIVEVENNSLMKTLLSNFQPTSPLGLSHF